VAVEDAGLGYLDVLPDGKQASRVSFLQQDVDCLTTNAKLQEGDLEQQ